MRIVKFLAFIAGLSILTFLNTRYKDKPNEAYGFLKFTSQNQESENNKEYMDLDASFRGGGSEGIDDGGGE